MSGYHYRDEIIQWHVNKRANFPSSYKNERFIFTRNKVNTKIS